MLMIHSRKMICMNILEILEEIWLKKSHLLMNFTIKKYLNKVNVLEYILEV